MAATAYLDESGDHNMTGGDPGSPLLTLAAVVLRDTAIPTMTSNLQALKRRHFGADTMILHSRDIRRQLGSFRVLADPGYREAFCMDFNALITATPLTIISVTIDKVRFAARYINPAHPYHFALEMLLERLAHWAIRQPAPLCATTLIAESRGKREDQELRDAFAQVHAHGTNYQKAAMLQHYCPQLQIQRKTENIAGLQLADLVAYPIKQYHLGQADPRTWKVLLPTFYRGNTGNLGGYGLKRFP